MKLNSSDPSHDINIREEDLFHQFIGEIKEYAIFIMDTNGHIKTWNQGAEQIKGYSPHEIIGSHYRILFPEDNQKEKIPEEELAHAKKYGRFENEAWRRRKSGVLFWANVVLTAISDKQGEVKYLIKVTRDLTERKKAEDALYRQNKKLAKLNADLDNFVYTASHDLKSPVLNLAGLLDMLETEQDPEKQAHIHQYLRQSVARLQETISELSDIARVQKDLDIGNEEEEVDFERLLEDIKFSISTKMREDCPHIETDLRVRKINFSKLNLKSILFNLVSNAIKYRSPKRACTVKVSSYSSKGLVVLQVEDNGLGMPAGYEEKIFKMFTRLNVHPEGSGVGLYMVKRIVDNASGRIEVYSEQGKGSTFKVLLPIETQA